MGLENRLLGIELKRALVGRENESFKPKELLNLFGWDPRLVERARESNVHDFCVEDYVFGDDLLGVANAIGDRVLLYDAVQAAYPKISSDKDAIWSKERSIVERIGNKQKTGILPRYVHDLARNPISFYVFSPGSDYGSFIGSLEERVRPTMKAHRTIEVTHGGYIYTNMSLEKNWYDGLVVCILRIDQSLPISDGKIPTQIADVVYQKLQFLCSPGTNSLPSGVKAVGGYLPERNESYVAVAFRGEVRSFPDLLTSNSFGVRDVKPGEEKKEGDHNIIFSLAKVECEEVTTNEEPFPIVSSFRRRNFYQIINHFRGNPLEV